MPAESGVAATAACSDGFVLRLRHFDAEAPGAPVMLLSPASGVPARFYFSFAAWLAERGFSAVTWDWRGIGENRPATLKGFPATMLDWALLDQPAIVDWALARYNRPLIGLGHSFGGQAFGLADRPRAFSQLVLFASGHAYWRLWPAPGRYLFRAGIAGLSAITRATGYLPGRALGLGADLPAGVALQWLGWCLEPDYHGRWDGHAQISAPVLSYGFSDDGYAPLASRQALLAHYGGPRDIATVHPADVGLERIGHLDFFRRRHAESLWPHFLSLASRQSALL